MQNLNVTSNQEMNETGTEISVPVLSASTDATPPKGKKTKGVSYSKYGVIFILPYFIIFLIFQLYPILYSIGISFTNYSGETEATWAGLENYKMLLTGVLSRRFLTSILNTFIIWIVSFIPQIVCSFLFAAIFTSINFKILGKGAFKVIYYMPNIIMATSVAVLFKQLTTYPGGLLDNLFKNWGLIRDPQYNIYTDPWGARFLISFIQFWRYFGYTMIALAAGMLGINPTFYEAATIDGASRAKMFFSITIPLLRPIVLYTLVTSLVGGLQIFEIPYLLTEGYPMLGGGAFATETVAVYIYQFAFGNALGNQYAIASAGSVYLFIISVILSFIVFKFFGKEAFGREKKARTNPDKKEGL